MPRGRARTTGAIYNRTMREQESQEDRESRFDRQRLQRTNHLTPGQPWVPLLVLYMANKKLQELAQDKTGWTKIVDFIIWLGG